MKLNGIDKIESDGRDYLLLVDYGCEGISVMGQYETLDSALQASFRAGSDCKAIVKLVDIPLPSE